MPPQAHVRTAGMQAKRHVFKLSRPPQQRYCKGKTSVNADMAKWVNVGAGMGLARGERCKGVKKEGCIKKQDTRLNFYVITMIIGGDLKYAANNENM